MSFANTHTPTKPTTKARWQVPTRPKAVHRKCKDGHISVMYVDEYYLEGELLDRFCQMFPKHSNIRLMRWFGISFSTLQRFKRELSLQKDMKAIRRQLASDIKKTCEANGYYDSLRGKAPSEACLEATRRMRAEGFHPLRQLKKKNPRKFKRLQQRKSEQRKALINSDRKRVRLGLTPHSRLPMHILGGVRPYTKAEIHKRHSALKRGYILSFEPEDRYAIFYDDDTQRAPIFESNCIAIGFTIDRWVEEMTDLNS